ncbi:fasciclin domain-containing protein [Sphingobacterium sp. 1.A.4]|uniref:fasciclin domain-containing protein n=1 Tax=Sphingobacterium sp. 1.A.4 TaxID=2044603 RepID=UPI000C0BD310|nr:fasciclin domain-containing protein [Sphingobacterium sp. 1.A.4]
MKNQKHIVWKLAVVMLICFTGCKKYYFDSGIHDPKFNGSSIKYLESKLDFFDSTLMVIDLAGIKNVIENEEVTFFAPPSGCITRAVLGLNRQLQFNGKDTVKELSQIKPQVWKNMLSNYIFKGKNLLKDYPQRDTVSYLAYPGQNYTSYGGRIMNIGVIYNDAGGVQYAGYRQLFLAYIPDLSNPMVSLRNIPIATSDIQTNNGVIHVLNRTKHTFGFFSNTFIDQAISAGIDPLTP